MFLCFAKCPSNLIAMDFKCLKILFFWHMRTLCSHSVRIVDLQLYSWKINLYPKKVVTTEPDRREQMGGGVERREKEKRGR